MKSILTTLNGWQRLWFVFSVICLVLVTALVFILWRETNRVEDAQLLTQLNDSEVVRVNIPDVGQVAFPNSLTEKEITKIIDENYKTDRKKIPEIAKQLVIARNARDAENARRENHEARKDNGRLVLVAYGAWLLFVVSVYLLGYATGWIQRGFKST